MSLALGLEPRVEVDQGFIPSKGGGECGCEEGAPQTAASARNVPLAFVFAAVVIEGSKAGQCGRLFAIDTAELGHADQERERGAFADTGNAEHEIKTRGEIAVSL